MKNIAVYCGASIGTNENIQTQATLFGQQLAKNNHTLVYGAGGTGIMGLIGRACRDNGGDIYAVIPDFLRDFEEPISRINELHIVNTMHTRKQMMFDKADAFVIFPGGLGTLDEVFEILTWKILQQHDKPFVFVNIDGFWDALLKHIDYLVEAEFSGKNTHGLFEVVQNQKNVLESLHKMVANKNNSK